MLPEGRGRANDSIAWRAARTDNGGAKNFRNIGGYVVSEELVYMSAIDLLRRYRAKELSPVEATRAILDRIAALNGKVNAFRLVDEEAAMTAARQSEARWARGEPAGLVDGVPATIKDLVLTKGWTTLRGSKTVDPGQPWDEDAPVVARLREHGAVLVGKTTTPEFGWKGVTDSPLTGITRNPWDLSKTPGGSSGGASAAAAAGMGCLHVGTDGGGSIRIPAGFAGIFGHKPSYGRVPAYPASPFGTLANVGPMTRTVADAALMLRVLAMPDSRDWLSLPYDGIDYSAAMEGGVKGLKVAFSPALGYARVDDEVADAVAAAARTFSDLGAEVEEVDPGFADPTPHFTVLWKSGAYNALRSLSDAQMALIDPGLAMAVEQGSRYGLGDFLDANAARAALGIHMRRFNDRYDLLLTPSLAVPAFDAGRNTPSGRDAEEDWMSWTPFSYPFNMTQHPACSVPCGFTAAGLPVGLQIVGPMYHDDLVLRAAQAYEAANPLWQGGSDRAPVRPQL